MRPGARDTGVDEGVEDPSLRLAQPRHDRHGQRRERLAGVATHGAPGDLAAETPLGFARDRHALLAGLLAEARDPALLRVGATLDTGEPPDDEHLVPVDRR